MKLPKLKQNDRVEILWHDAHDCTEEGKTWLDRDVKMEPVDYACLSLGYFIKVDDGFIYIAGDILSGFPSMVFVIPVGCIKAVKKL